MHLSHFSLGPPSSSAAIHPCSALSFVFLRQRLSVSLLPMCGYEGQCTPNNSITKVEINLEAIDMRLQHLRNCTQSSFYSKQKSSLRIDFDFLLLSSLPNVKTLHFATPTDVSRFLVWKDRNGKTVLHVIGCPDAHLQGTAKCVCPRRLSFKTVDSYILGSFVPFLKN